MADNIECKRFSQIDVLKGIGIILLIIGHCVNNGDKSMFVNFVNSFHMPLFFFASGILWKRRPLKDNVMSCFFGLVIPLSICYLVNFIPKIIFSFVHTEYNDQLLYILSFKGLWFLWSLLIIRLFFSLFDSLFHNIKYYNIILTACVIIIFALGLFISYYDKTLIHSYVLTALIGGGFYYIGIVFRRAIPFVSNLLKPGEKNSCARRILFAVVGIVILTCIFFLKTDFDVYMYENEYGNIGYFIMKSVLGIGGITLLAFSISSCRPLEFLGKNSLTIMLVHFSIYLGIRYIFAFFEKRDVLYTFPMNIVYIAIVIILSALLSILINRFCPPLSGKWKIKEKQEEQ